MGDINQYSWVLKLVIYKGPFVVVGLVVVWCCVATFMRRRADQWRPPKVSRGGALVLLPVLVLLGVTAPAWSHSAGAQQSACPQGWFAGTAGQDHSKVCSSSHGTMAVTSEVQLAAETEEALLGVTGGNGWTPNGAPFMVSPGFWVLSGPAGVVSLPAGVFISTQAESIDGPCVGTCSNPFVVAPAFLAALGATEGWVAGSLSPATDLVASTGSDSGNDVLQTVGALLGLGFLAFVAARTIPFVIAWIGKTFRAGAGNS